MSAEYTTHINGLRVQVDKIGGGTPGREYEGEWSVTVENGPVYVFDRDLMLTGTSKTHEEVARQAADFASERIDNA